MKPLRALAAATLAALTFSAHAVGRLADVSVFDRVSGRELPVHWHEGRAYVVGKPGNEYQVVVRNRRGEDLLAVVSVDGLNVMNGATASTSQGGYIVQPWGRVDIRGWRKSLDEVAAFYFTSLGDSYAARTERPQNVGVVGVALFQRKRQPPPPAFDAAPYEEPQMQLKRESADSARSAPSESRAQGPMPMQPSAPLGTGHGRREESRMRWADFERATQEPVETIAIYYDSYRNLAALGILQTPLGPRDPSPFPAVFTPDPYR